MEGVTPPILSNVQESWSKFSHVAGELATLFFVTVFFSKNSWSIGQPPPPQWKVSQQIAD